VVSTELTGGAGGGGSGLGLATELVVIVLDEPIISVTVTCVTMVVVDSSELDGGGAGASVVPIDVDEDDGAMGERPMNPAPSTLLVNDDSVEELDVLGSTDEVSAPAVVLLVTICRLACRGR